MTTSETQIFKATIRHCNEKLGLDDKTVFLRRASDGYYVAETKEEAKTTCGELSWNWDIIEIEEQS